MFTVVLFGARSSRIVSLKALDVHGEIGGYTARTVAKEDLALALKGSGIRREIRLTNLKVGFYINEGAFLQVTKIIICKLGEG